MHSFVLTFNTAKESVQKTKVYVEEYLRSRDAEVTVIGDCVTQARQEDGVIRPLLQKADCLVVFGGDGTILNGARLAAPFNLPVLGVNLGQLGFLTEVDRPQIGQALDDLLSGRYTIEERMMLEASIFRGAARIESAIGLNDAVVATGAFARLVHLKTYINDEYLNTYPADGIIVASPTGSTAYSLSAGGPLVAPGLDLLLLTPICPHTLWSRPVVIGAENVIRISIASMRGDAALTIDGQHGFALQQNDVVVVRRSNLRARFVKLKRTSFFALLREKLKE